MYLGQVVGTVVATVKHASHRGQRLLLVQPMTYSFEPDGPVFAAIDLSGAGPDTWVFYVKGREAANALPEKQNPSDRTIMGIVDQVTLEALGADNLPGAPPASTGGSTAPHTP
ncbi:MAG TPA: EutN/CcmL family microcompartment protein [Candidatus Krumholzibacteria bacterium]|nr:EutN/CcmL family microcompartment protein [Candidatus Krumholzibacteria bacterium]